MGTNWKEALTIQMNDTIRVISRINNKFSLFVKER